MKKFVKISTVVCFFNKLEYVEESTFFKWWDMGTRKNVCKWIVEKWMKQII